MDDEKRDHRRSIEHLFGIGPVERWPVDLCFPPPPDDDGKARASGLSHAGDNQRQDGGDLVTKAGERGGDNAVDQSGRGR